MYYRPICIRLEALLPRSAAQRGSSDQTQKLQRRLKETRGQTEKKLEENKKFSVFLNNTLMKDKSENVAHERVLRRELSGEGQQKKAVFSQFYVPYI